MHLPEVKCLIGATASGKTALACQWFDAQQDVALISVDSALVYQGMDIGTAKPTQAELARYPHALIDICQPNQVYSVGEFIADVQVAIDSALAEGKKPLLVGGTIMYFNALLDGLAAMPPADSVVRAQLQQQMDSEGLAALHAELAAVDRLSAAKFNPSDKQRIVRALEVYKLSGKPITYWHSLAPTKLPYRFKLMAIDAPRPWLHQRIEQRLANMWQQDLLGEVAGLMAQPWFNPDLPGMRAVGYRQVIDYLTLPAEQQNSAALADMQNKALYATRQLAKRQDTWLRGLKSRYEVELISHNL